MELVRLTDRVFYLPYEEEKDRPVLGYIRGDRMSLAVDAGHSAAHVDEFYDALRRAGLPLPQITVLTHWHWDHTFGLHRTGGVSVAGEKTNAHLRSILETYGAEGERLREHFTGLDESIRLEYAGGQEMKVRPADITFSGALSIDLGGVCVCLRETVSPHTDDAVLVWIPEEKCLFLGDSTSGVFPDWKFEPEPMGALIREIEGYADCKFALHGHVPVLSGKEMAAHLREELAQELALRAGKSAPDSTACAHEDKKP